MNDAEIEPLPELSDDDNNDSDFFATLGNVSHFEWIEENTTLSTYQFDPISLGLKFQADQNSEEIFYFKKFMSEDIIVNETNIHYIFQISQWKLAMS